MSKELIEQVELEKTTPKDKALKLLLNGINGVKRGKEQVGPLRIGFLSQMRPAKVEVIPSGSLALDLALGVGGYVRGRIIEVFGEESSGKSTLALHAVANCQAAGGLAAFIDMEHSVDLQYARDLGANVDEVLFSQPDSGDDAMEIADALAKSGLIDLIIVDSVAALLPREELEKEITDPTIALIARLMSKSLRRLSPACSQTGTTLLFTNQIREKPMTMMGSPLTTPGGRALKFFAAQRLHIRKGKPIKDRDRIIGCETHVKIVKNKVARPFNEAHFNIMFGQGIDSFTDLIATASDLGVIERAGPYYKYQGENLGQGLSNTIEYLREHQEKIIEIRERTLGQVDVEISGNSQAEESEENW